MRFFPPPFHWCVGLNCLPSVDTANSLPDTVTQPFVHKHLRGWLIVYSLERATYPEGACHARQPPQVSCPTGGLNTIVSWPAVRHGRQALGHPCSAQQWHRRQHKPATASPRCARAQRPPPPTAVANAVRGGSTTPASWRRALCFPRQTSSSVLAPCRRWGSSWMGAGEAVGAPRG